ncbi:hypothetical protein LTR36_008616 [Oleoguttula mirabilis]|uniref:NAD-dependent epimerase/dehydratase domain-containing protein n=1 Tax=Oleoguttula mirabilis TaxID=1507867 RepID=A0AAV9JTJ1_9PEZI|nr:hypothetical protein LTR36_008616 [Oleoguttula mirabilis]
MAETKVNDAAADLAIPIHSLVLVTGTSGFLGSHIADQLLLAGYRVRGTTRDLSRSSWVAKLFHERYGKDAFELRVVPEMAAEGAFDRVIEGCDAVVHVAATTTYAADPNTVIRPTVNGLQNVLSAASRTPSIRRFVLTSSSTAARQPAPNKEFHVDSSSWNDAIIEKAWAPPPYEASRSRVVYGASKVEEEHALWTFVDQHHPNFVVNAVLPNFNIGEILSPSPPKSSSSGWVRGLYEGDKADTEYMRSFTPQYMVDVKDTARLHVAALMFEDVRGERLFAFAEPFNYKKLISCMSKVAPNGRHELPDGIEDAAEDVSTVANGRSVELLRRLGRQGWTPMEQSVEENVGVASGRSALQSQRS